MEAIQVFCGSNSGHNKQYGETASKLGKLLAWKDIRLVYGGGNVGLMGLMADAALENSGEVIGVIPHFLREREVCHENLTELHLTDSMHERKLKMAELSDATLVLPGGFGTLDELFEMLTLNQLGVTQQAIGILNTGGYFTFLLKQLDQMVAEGFLKPAHRAMVLADDDLEALVKKVENYQQPPKTGKWL